MKKVKKESKKKATEQTPESVQWVDQKDQDPAKPTLKSGEALAEKEKVVKDMQDGKAPPVYGSKEIHLSKDFESEIRKSANRDVLNEKILGSVAKGPEPTPIVRRVRVGEDVVDNISKNKARVLVDREDKLPIVSKGDKIIIMDDMGYGFLCEVTMTQNFHINHLEQTSIHEHRSLKRLTEREVMLEKKVEFITKIWFCVHEIIFP